MESEISGIKNVPFIPSSSPPPIESISTQSDYEDLEGICDLEDMYDITGLSQKLNKCEEKVNLTQIYQFEKDHLSVLREDKGSNHLEDKIKHITSDKKSIDIRAESSEQNETSIYSYPSPPPLNCIAPSTPERQSNINNEEHIKDSTYSDHSENLSKSSPMLENEHTFANSPSSDSSFRTNQRNDNFSDSQNELQGSCSDDENTRESNGGLHSQKCENSEEDPVSGLTTLNCIQSEISCSVSTENSLPEDEEKSSTDYDQRSDSDFGEFISPDDGNLQKDVKHNYSTPIDSDLTTDSNFKERKPSLTQSEDEEDEFGDFASTTDTFSPSHQIHENNNFGIPQSPSKNTVLKPLPETTDEREDENSVSNESLVTLKPQLSPGTIEKDETVLSDTGAFTKTNEERDGQQKTSDDESANTSSSSTSISAIIEYKETSKDGEGDSALPGMCGDDDDFGEFNGPETSANLQLEFSDDEDEQFGSDLDSDSSHPLPSAVPENGGSDNKFRSLVMRWIPTSGFTLPEKDCSITNIIKLGDVIEGDAFIWHHLEDIDSSLALKLSWPSSQANKFFLSSLNVDARNILYGHKWSSNIPVFAQTLSFSPLTPAKPSAKSAPWPLEETILVQDKTPSDSVLDEGKSQPVNVIESKEEEKTIPPAQFDWSSSGLTNPLDTPASFSSLFDYKISLLGSKGGFRATNNSPSSLEDDILNTLSPDPTTKPDEGGKSRTTSIPILEKILKDSAVGQTQSTDLSSLPCDVRKAVKRLPDLNFMRSKVLMFPLRDGS